MTKVIVDQAANGFEHSLRDFSRRVQAEGIIREIRRRSFFVPAAEARRQKSIEARRRNRSHAPKAPDKRTAQV